MDHYEEQAEPSQGAFGFTGNWREFLPIALTNLALTIVTLGVYRFWGQVRERHYLWSHSRFIDSNLEWTGTGKELFVGFVAGALLFGVPLFVINFGLQAAIFQGHEGIAAFVSMTMFALLYYFIGVAKFRALRYRLSRTYWRGIRGGSYDAGLKYGWSYIWKNVVGWLPGGLLIPWSMTSLWNERWNRMSFGSHNFYSDADFSSLMKRFLLFYLSPIILIVVSVVVGMVGAIASSAADIGPSDAPPEQMGFLVGIGIVGIIYLVIPLIWLIYYAKFYRVAVASLRLEKLEFSFGAKTKHWFFLFLGDAVLWLGAAAITLIPLVPIMVSLGLWDGSFKLPEPGAAEAQFQAASYIGLMVIFIVPSMLIGPFLRYRHWAFFMRHMEAYGEIDIAALTQSETKVNKHGEGLLDALDVGAF